MEVSGRRRNRRRIGRSFGWPCLGDTPSSYFVSEAILASLPLLHVAARSSGTELIRFSR